MGLTASSTGINAIDTGLKKNNENDKIIALAGNPNVGKSSVFNQLTGLRQHTGNWPGKTVSNAQGICTHKGKNYILVDIPGTYSLMPHSQEEEVARDFLCFGDPDAVIIVCDATCLERNMALVLQALEITPNAVVCVNLMDEAKKRGIKIDLNKISDRLGIPVIGCVARSGKGLDDLMDSAENALFTKRQDILQIKYLKPIEDALDILVPVLSKKVHSISPRWLGLRLLEQDKTIKNRLSCRLELDIDNDIDVQRAFENAYKILRENNISREKLSDIIASCTVLAAEGICCGAVHYSKKRYREFDRRLDKLLTSKITGIPAMLLLFSLIFWITVSGANILSEILSGWFDLLEGKLLSLCLSSGIPEIIYSPLIFGIYHVLAWVVSVMLPPMAIFFPLFTLLEDLGYLPRIAFNLDKCFKKCSACGKQALTMR